MPIFLTIILALVLFSGYVLKNKLESEKNKTQVTVIYPPSSPPPSVPPLNPKIPVVFYDCKVDEDCMLDSVNCCTERGAQWACINKTSNTTCQDVAVICVDILTPRPNVTCKCVNGVCRS